MDISDIFKLLQNNTNDVDDVKRITENNNALSK